NYNISARTGDNGMSILRRIVQNELSWIFRVNHNETDFGIDAYFDVIINRYEVTGKTIATQVKTGKSYFSEKNELGWAYRGKISHLNDDLHHDIAVIIIIVDEKSELAYWNICDPNKIESAGQNWKITIPFKNNLNSNSKDELIKYISPINDYASQL